MGKDIQYVAHPLRRRIGQVETLTVESGLVRDVGHRLDHIVDRDDIDAAALDADGWHPWRQQPANVLDQFEEIVGTVDLVHFPGVRVAHHQARPVHPPGTLHSSRTTFSESCLVEKYG